MLKALLTDVDGTITDASRRIDTGAIECIRSLVDDGIEVVLASGNTACFMDALCKMAGTRGTFIAENGGVYRIGYTGTLKITGDQAICRAAPGPYAIATVPLLTEGGGRAAYPWLHRILVVDTPAAVQKARLMQRDGIDATLADQMMAAQASRAERLALADDIVVNDGDIHHLQHAADALHLRYLALATATP